jgi:hypothetical protein
MMKKRLSDIRRMRVQAQPEAQEKARAEVAPPDISNSLQ